MATHRLVLVFEDKENTHRLVRQLADAPFFGNLEIELLDAGMQLATVTMPKPPQNEAIKTLVLSRCSGSYMTRGHACSPTIIETLLFAASHTCGYNVFNGSSAFRLECNKLLAFVDISSDLFRRRCETLADNPTKRCALSCPKTVGITQVNARLLRRTIEKHGMGSKVYIKGIVGGESSNVRRITSVDNEAAIARQLRSDDGRNLFHDDVTIVQDEVPHAQNGHYRFELIDAKLYYVVRIRQRGTTSTTKPRNVCLCDIDIDDPSIELNLFRNADELTDVGLEDGNASAIDNARSIVACLEEFARRHQLHVLAVEGTISDGRLHLFDVNTNTNYNSELERRSEVEPAAWQVVKTMMAKT